MADSTSDLKDVSTNFTRKLAGRQVPALREYVAALEEYANGKADEAQFAKRVLNLGFREATRGAQDFFNLASEFYSRAFALAGINVNEALDKASVHAAASHTKASGKR